METSTIMFGMIVAVSEKSNCLQTYGSATVSGGSSNTAGGLYASVTGGWYNFATGNYSYATGGTGNTASGELSAIFAGLNSSCKT